MLFGSSDARSERVGERLGDGDLDDRYHLDDGLDGEEAPFTACAFRRSAALRSPGALRRLRCSSVVASSVRPACANDVGLFAEALDAATVEQRGNLPKGCPPSSLLRQIEGLHEWRMAGSS